MKKCNEKDFEGVYLSEFGSVQQSVRCLVSHP